MPRRTPVDSACRDQPSRGSFQPRYGDLDLTQLALDLAEFALDLADLAPDGGELRVRAVHMFRELRIGALNELGEPLCMFGESAVGAVDDPAEPAEHRHFGNRHG